MHAPIAVIDPHLTWYGEFRFYEMRIYGGELAIRRELCMFAAISPLSRGDGA